MAGIKILPTKKGNGLHLFISHASPPGHHKLTLDFSTTLTLATQLLREALKGLVVKDMETLESWQVQSIRESFDIFIELQNSSLFQRYILELLEVVGPR